MSADEQPPSPGRPAGPGRAVVVLLVGVALVVLGAFLPWVWSGTSSRSSFAMVRSADRLGLVDDGIGLVVLRAWYLVPLIAAAVVVLVTFHRRRSAAAVGVALAAVVALVAVVVLAVAPEAGSGPVVGLVGAATVAAGAIGVLVSGRSAPSPSGS